MTKNVPADKIHEVRERPGEARLELEILQEQDRGQCCPNLRLQGVRCRPHEGLDLQVLLDGLEEDLDLPAVLVDGGDGRGGEHEIVGQETHLGTVVAADGNQPERIGAVQVRLRSGEDDHLIGDYAASIQDGKPCADGLEDAVVLHACHEEDASLGPLVEEGVVDVAPVHCHDAAHGQASSQATFTLCVLPSVTFTKTGR